MEIIRCNEFAYKILLALSEYDIGIVESQFSEISNHEAISRFFPKPEGFEYKKNVSIEDIVSYSGNSKSGGIWFDFEMPFEGDQYRPMIVRTKITEVDGCFRALLIGVFPS